MYNFLQPYGLWPARPLCPWDFPGKNAGVGCHFLLQGTFPTQMEPSSPVSCIGRQVLYTSTTWEAPVNTMWKRKTVRHSYAIYFKGSLSLRFFNCSFCSPEYDFDSLNYNRLLEPWNIPDDVLWKNREA